MQTLENATMYTMEIRDMNSNAEVSTVTKPGWELLGERPWLVVGQNIEGWLMYTVNPLGA